MATKKRLGILTASTVIAALAGGAAVVGSGSAPTVPGTTVEQQQSAKQATTSGMPAQTLNVSAASQAFIPLVNVPIHRRRDAVWLGRVRDRAGNPMGSWNRRCGGRCA